MAKPPRRPNLPETIADHERRLRTMERREAFASKRAWIAAAGGLHALPVPLVAPDTSGWYDVTSSTFSDFIAFTAPASSRLWVLLAANGLSDPFEAQLLYPAQFARLLGEAEYIGTDPLFGPTHLLVSEPDADLAAGSTVYDRTVVLQARTTDNVTTNLFRVLACGWGTPNV